MISILKPGLLTTIQDLGRYGYQKDGVVVGGAMDTYSHRVANILVGNDENAPTIEMTLIGATIQFSRDSLIAITGGNLSPTIDNKRLPMWRPILIRKNQILRFGECIDGCRAYLSLAGGIWIPKVLGSASTYARAKMGGWHGRPLKAGDQIPLGDLQGLSKKIMEEVHLEGSPKWSIPPRNRTPFIRVIKGREFHAFTRESQNLLFNSEFQITPASDRMGYRLSGPALLLKEKKEMLSEAVDFGTIQVTSDGKPVILLADRQTTGGYPKIAHVISADLPILAQMKPGDRIRFKEVALEEAQALLREQERYFSILKRLIELKFR